MQFFLINETLKLKFKGEYSSKDKTPEIVKYYFTNESGVLVMTKFIIYI